jgi:tripartite-type tricarboxylate transporter receptor subunit TctC
VNGQQGCQRPANIPKNQSDTWSAHAVDCVSFSRVAKGRGMKLLRRQFLQLAGATVVVPALPHRASALDYPTRPVRWLVGFAPGSPADAVVRITGRWLSDRIGQPFIVENKPGAATNISLQAVVTAPADGYTLVYLSGSATVNRSLYKSLSFDVLRDIAPVAGIVDFPFVMLVHPSFPAATVAEFVSYAKANPGKIRLASFGTGTTSHLAGELFKKMADVNMIHVPYRASAAAHIDMISGRVEVMFDTLTSPLPHIRSGALRALAMAGSARYEQLPDIPTIGETVHGYEMSGWAGVGAPKATPPEIIDRLNREINAGLGNSAVKAQLAQISTTPIFFTSDEFGTFMAADAKKWAKVVEFAAIKPD